MTKTTTPNNPATAALPANFVPAKPHRVGVDMDAPFCVYLDGEPVAEYATEEPANIHFRRLINEQREAKAAREVA